MNCEHDWTYLSGMTGDSRKRDHRVCLYCGKAETKGKMGWPSDRERDYNEFLYDYGVKRYGRVPEYVRF